MCESHETFDCCTCSFIQTSVAVVQISQQWGFPFLWLSAVTVMITWPYVILPAQWPPVDDSWPCAVKMLCSVQTVHGHISVIQKCTVTELNNVVRADVRTETWASSDSSHYCPIAVAVSWSRNFFNVFNVLTLCVWIHYKGHVVKHFCMF